MEGERSEPSWEGSQLDMEAWKAEGLHLSFFPRILWNGVAELQDEVIRPTASNFTPLHERGGGLGALVVVGSDRCLETTSQGKRVGSAVKLWTEHPAGSCPVISSHLALNLFSLHQCSYPHFSQGNHCRHPKAIGILVCEKLPRKTWKSQPITWVIHLKT